MNDMTLISTPIYKIDTTGRLRTWSFEVDGDRYRTVSGLVDGAQVVSKWTVCTPKSKPTAPEQARFEAEAMERHKLERTYHRTPEACSKPNFFEPMLAKPYGKAFSLPVYNQPKLDGIRCIARAEGLFSRQGKPITSCPHIEEDLAPLFALDPDLILDGELYNHELKADFEKIVSIVRKQKPSDLDLEESRRMVQYHVYDVPSIAAPFGERAGFLPFGSSICPVETRLAVDQDQLDADYAEFLTAGYEGQMVRLDAPYEQKRSKHLLKRKEFLDAEFEIVAIEEGLGNWSGYAKRVVFKLPDGRTCSAGIAGNQQFCAVLLEQRSSWIGKLVTVKYFTPTSDGMPRFPVAIKFHEGEKL